ncbi:MAG: hypothetical protein H7270_00985 [Dermatophilaceae bacterium]|nr:hypothetical protein [Dermatophilaceae bacterium]
MTLELDALLAGPRGRRLCLEFALRTTWDSASSDAEELRQAIFLTAYDLDPGRGTSRVLFGPGAERFPPPTPSPEDIARLLDTLPLAEPHEGAMLLSLTTAVDRARYWQEPDGEDVLAAAPALHDPLARIAASLVASSHARWWATPMDSAQWAVTFVEADAPRPAATKGAGQTLEQWRAAQLKEETVAERERPSDARARWSGTWWSKPPAALTQTTRSLGGRGPVGLRLIEDGFGWESATAEQVAVPRDARVYEIDGPAAWADLCRRHPLEVTASRRHDWYRATGRIGRWVIPDWTQVQHDIDAVHLSADGYLTTAGLAIPVDDDLATVLAGWNPDQTYWFRDVTRSASTHQAWTYHQKDDNWELSTAR